MRGDVQRYAVDVASQHRTGFFDRPQPIAKRQNSDVQLLQHAARLGENGAQQRQGRFRYAAGVRQVDAPPQRALQRRRLPAAAHLRAAQESVNRQRCEDILRYDLVRQLRKRHRLAFQSGAAASHHGHGR